MTMVMDAANISMRETLHPRGTAGLRLHERLDTTHIITTTTTTTTLQVLLEYYNNNNNYYYCHSDEANTRPGTIVYKPTGTRSYAMLLSVLVRGSANYSIAMSQLSESQCHDVVMMYDVVMSDVLMYYVVMYDV
jgi:hypothetical protein